MYIPANALKKKKNKVDVSINCKNSPKKAEIKGETLRGRRKNVLGGVKEGKRMRSNFMLFLSLIP